MKNFMKSFQLLSEVVKKEENGEYEDKEALRDDLFFVFGVMKQNFPEFPFFISSEDKQGIIREVIDNNQTKLAKEWMEMEPELKYRNEWDHKEAIEGFEEYLIQQAATLAANQVADILKESVEKDYRKNLRTHTRRDDILNLYDKFKNEQNKETVFLPSTKKEDKES